MTSSTSSTALSNCSYCSDTDTCCTIADDSIMKRKHRIWYHFSFASLPIDKNLLTEYILYSLTTCKMMLLFSKYVLLYDVVFMVDMWCPVPLPFFSSCPSMTAASVFEPGRGKLTLYLSLLYTCQTCSPLLLGE